MSTGYVLITPIITTNNYNACSNNRLYIPRGPGGLILNPVAQVSTIGTRCILGSALSLPLHRRWRLHRYLKSTHPSRVVIHLDPEKQAIPSFVLNACSIELYRDFSFAYQHEGSPRPPYRQQWYGIPFGSLA